MTDRNDMDDLDRVADILGSITAEDRVLDTPPPGLWDAIAARLDDEPSAAAVAALHDRRSARSYRPLLAAAAAAVIIVIGAIGALLALRGDGDDELIEASVPLRSLDGSETELARADLVYTNGSQAVRIDLEGLELPTDGFLELWVIDTDVVGMHSLGIVSADGTFALPPGLDPADFPVVDISIEPVDGDPTHSGNSVARGVLDLG